ncbi:MAG: hypothetical protein ACRC49_04865 [Plesiomonas sp.]
MCASARAMTCYGHRRGGGNNHDHQGSAWHRFISVGVILILRSDNVIYNVSDNIPATDRRLTPYKLPYWLKQI